MSARAPRLGLARLTSAMILTRDAGARAESASSAAGRASASDSTSARLRAARRSEASARAPATRESSTLVVGLRGPSASTNAVAGLGENPAKQSAHDEQAKRGPDDHGQVEEEGERAHCDGDEHDDYGNPGRGRVSFAGVVVVVCQEKLLLCVR